MKKFQDNPIVSFLIALMFFPSLGESLENRHVLTCIMLCLILFVLLQPNKQKK